MRDSYGMRDWHADGNRRRGNRKILGWGIAVFLVLAIIGGLGWLIFGYYLDNFSTGVRTVTREFIVQDFVPSVNPLHWTPMAYFCIALFAVIVCACVSLSGSESGQSRQGAIAMVSCAVIALGSGVYFVTGLWQNDRDGAIPYAQSTKFVVDNPDHLPASLQPLIQGATRNQDGSPCAYTTKHDVPSCITTGEFPQGWKSRTASLTGATFAMQRTSGVVPNTTVMTDTMTYLNDEKSWSAIRNGINKQPLNGVVLWDGKGGTQDVKECLFRGKYSLDKAFGGHWGQNLASVLARKYPAQLYRETDMWGYCKGNGPVSTREPVIVIPTYVQQAFGRRTVEKPGGVLVITGSPSGEPVIKHLATVKPGTLPGPVYPMSITADQRDAVEWAAGRANKNRLHFGFEDTDGVGQDDANTSDYLLQDAKTGRLEWVTPLKPRSSDSQLVVAYSVTPADEVTSGKLNTQKVYVLPDGSQRIVNLNTLDSRVQQALKNSNPGFFTGSGNSAGKVTEYLPVGTDTWQAYAEQSGRVVYRIDINVNDSITPKVVTLDDSVEGIPAQGSDTPESSGPVVGDTIPACTSPAKLSKDQLVQCINLFAGELAKR